MLETAQTNTNHSFVVAHIRQTNKHSLSFLFPQLLPKQHPLFQHLHIFCFLLIDLKDNIDKPFQFQKAWLLEENKKLYTSFFFYSLSLSLFSHVHFDQNAPTPPIRPSSFVLKYLWKSHFFGGSSSRSSGIWWEELWLPGLLGSKNAAFFTPKCLWSKWVSLDYVKKVLQISIAEETAVFLNSTSCSWSCALPFDLIMVLAGDGDIGKMAQSGFV